MSHNPATAQDDAASVAESAATEQAQAVNIDSGLACLMIMAQLHGIPADADQLSHQFRKDTKPFGQTEILLAAKHLELKAKSVKIDFTRIEKTPLPAVACDNEGNFFILARFDKGQVLIQSPKVGRPESLSLEELGVTTEFGL